jgi:hypothetical protein
MASLGAELVSPTRTSDSLTVDSDGDGGGDCFGQTFSPIVEEFLSHIPDFNYMLAELSS